MLRESQVLGQLSLPASIAESLEKLGSGRDRWASLSDEERAKVARACRAQFSTLDMAWVEPNLRVLGIEPSQHDAYNTLGMDPFLFIAVVIERLDKIAERFEGKLKVPPVDRQLAAASEASPFCNSEDGPLVYSWGDLGQSAPGCSLEVWADPNASPEAPVRSGVCVVLGAGNQNFLTAVDVIERAFLHKQCVLLKQHPIRPCMDSVFCHIFEPLANAGAYSQCLDSDVQGAHAPLVCHSDVIHVHMTGSGSTHNKVAAALDAGGRTDTGLTSELGCVSPWIICPGLGGRWSDEAIAHHAAMLTSAFKSSCSMNCLSPKVLVLPSEDLWPQRSQFLAALRTKLAEMPQFPPYYPGAHGRYNEFKRQYTGARPTVGDTVKVVNVEAADGKQYVGQEGCVLTDAQDHHPFQIDGKNGYWFFEADLEKSQEPSFRGFVEEIEAPQAQPGVVPMPEFSQLGQDLTALPSLFLEVGVLGSPNCNMYAIKNEAFAPVLAIATVGCKSTADFPMEAAKAVNKHVFGTLSCTLVYPDPRGPELDAVVRQLNYGCVAVNMFAALAYSNPLGVWGGAPGSYSRAKPESGLDLIGNVAGIPGARKSVAISPFQNKKVVMDKPIPMLVLDSLQVIVANRKCAAFKVLGMLCGRCCGLLPRTMPKPKRE